MPNRIIKESICYSEDIDKLTSDEEVFFYRLMVNCDDYGRMDARIPILKARLYPLREQMKASDIKRYLMKLSAIKPEPLILLYEKGGIQYLQMTKWLKHQQIRAKWSKYPAFGDEGTAMISNDIKCKQSQSNVTENPNPNPNPNIYVDFFETLWTMYPRKEGKGHVSQAKIKELYDIGLNEMTRAVDRYIKAKSGTDKKYLQMGSTFFNSGYIDYLDKNFQDASSEDDPYKDIKL